MNKTCHCGSDDLTAIIENKIYICNNCGFIHDEDEKDRETKIKVF